MFQGEEIESCAIVTRAAVPPLTAIHDRMPVVVAPKDYRDWLDPSVTDIGIFRQATEAEPPARIIVIDRVRGTG
jgi:putative SOS response-associated peptidase YedK